MFTTFSLSLKALLNDVQSGKIQLPDFQRGWVWDEDRIKGLLASISRGFPVGAVMTLAAGGDIRFRTRLVEGVSENGITSPDRFLLDGQQRLTSLYQALLHPSPVSTQDTRGEKRLSWFYIDMRRAVSDAADREDAVISVPQNKKVTRDFGRETVLDLSNAEFEYEELMFPTEKLFDPLEWTLNYTRYWGSRASLHPDGDPTEFFSRFNDGVIKPFADYLLPVIHLEKETPKEAVCTVFEKVNTGGVPLNVFELATAAFAAESEEFSLRDDWRDRRQRLYPSYGGVLQGIEGEHFLQAVALLKTQADRREAIERGQPANRLPAISCKRRDILNLDLPDYQKWADEVEEGFRKAAAFLQSQFIFGRYNVPYNTQLVPLSALYVELGGELEPALAREKLARWYWSGIFGEGYGGTTETQYALDLAQVAEYVRGGAEPILITQANFIPERLLTLRTRNSAAYKGLYALQMKNGASDWRSDVQLSLATYNNENIDIHHVFPVAWCRSKEGKPAIPSHLYDSVINKTPLSAATNRIIGGRGPAAYLKRLQEDMGSARLEQALEAHWLNPRHLEANNFQGSFVERGDALLKMIGRAMGRDPGSGREVFRKALQDALSSAEYFESFQVEEPEYNPLGEDAADEHGAVASD